MNAVRPSAHQLAHAKFIDSQAVASWHCSTAIDVSLRWLVRERTRERSGSCFAPNATRDLLSFRPDRQKKSLGLNLSNARYIEK